MPGSKLKNTKKIKEKLSKNYSIHITNLGQFPIELSHDHKENTSLSNIMVNRPHSSLVGSDVSGSVSKSKDKFEKSIGKKKKMNKKVSTKKNTMAIDQIQVQEK